MKEFKWHKRLANTAELHLVYYSIDTAYTCYSKLKWWQKLFGIKREWLGFDYHIEIRVDVHEYLRTNDIILINDEQWIVAFFAGPDLFVIQNIKPIKSRKPFTIGASITKLGSITES